MRDDYISFLGSKNTASTTITKYKYVTKCFMEFAKGRKCLRPEAVKPLDFWKFNEHMRDNDEAAERQGATSWSSSSSGSSGQWTRQTRHC